MQLSFDHLYKHHTYMYVGVCDYFNSYFNINLHTHNNIYNYINIKDSTYVYIAILKLCVLICELF